MIETYLGHSINILLSDLDAIGHCQGPGITGEALTLFLGITPTTMSAVSRKESAVDAGLCVSHAMPGQLEKSMLITSKWNLW